MTSVPYTRMPTSKPVRVLGLDPGLGTTGYGVIEVSGSKLSALAFGAIRTEPSAKTPQRLLLIQREISQLLQLWQPAVVGIERLAVGRNTPTVVAVSQARGVLVAACAAAGVTIAELTANQAKLGVTGFGRASKGQVARLLRSQLHIPDPITPDDAADALAIAVACSHLRPA
jgi:crossover junction endodeoxyribonuclease RuvC